MSKAKQFGNEWQRFFTQPNGVTICRPFRSQAEADAYVMPAGETELDPPPDIDHEIVGGKWKAKDKPAPPTANQKGEAFLRQVGMTKAELKAFLNG